MRQTAAILAIELQAYARTGDVSGWILGRDLVRDSCGTWQLEWTQSKTADDRVVGELWPEIGEILDELLLAGRPRRYAVHRYPHLVGSNWLTHGSEAMPSRQPSHLVRHAIGVPRSAGGGMNERPLSRGERLGAGALTCCERRPFARTSS